MTSADCVCAETSIRNCPLHGQGPAPFVEDADLTIWLGDVREVLPTLEAESVDCIATSPPFFGLRDYGTGTWEGGDPECDHMEEIKPGSYNQGFNERSGNASGARKQEEHGRRPFKDACRRCGATRIDRQIGLERTPEEWAAELVAVFRECRRLLRPSGSLWIECGDSYNAYNGNRGSSSSLSAAADVQRNATPRGLTTDELKPKDLLGQPFLLAFALRADGWYWRGCYPWAKPNAMPESVRDRCTTSHSYVLQFAKSSRYFFDGDAIAEPAAWERWGDQTVTKDHPDESAASWIKPRVRHELLALGGRTTNGTAPRTDERRGFDNRLERADGMKHPRSVWTIPTRGYPGAHFATWPEALAERILKAGCPEWVCGVCGKPRERLTEATGEYAEALEKPSWPSGGLEQGAGANKTVSVTRTTRTTGYTDCGHGSYQPGVCLDPFGGAGTTALVARRLGRKAVLVELNPEYAAMAAERCSQLSLLA